MSRGSDRAASGRSTCARVEGPILDAQPAQRANVVRRISSRVCTGLTLLRQECYWLADVQDLQEDYKDRWSGPSNVVNRRLDWRQRFGTGGGVGWGEWRSPHAL